MTEDQTKVLNLFRILLNTVKEYIEKRNINDLPKIVGEAMERSIKDVEGIFIEELVDSEILSEKQLKQLREDEKYLTEEALLTIPILIGTFKMRYGQDFQDFIGERIDFENDFWKT